jgi:hypothetical protein
MKNMEKKMKKIITIAATLVCLGGVLSASNFGIGISGSDEGIDSFSLSIGDFYGVPIQEVREVEYYVPHEHASIVYFLANNAGVNARYVTDLRRQGLNWWNISLRLGLDPYMLYRFDNRYYGKSRHHRLSDSEIADYVNVRFISDYHHINRHDIIDRRRQGEKYYRIHDFYHGKPDRPQYREERKVQTIQRERQEPRRDVREERRDDRRDVREDRRDDHRDVRNNQREERDKNSKSNGKEKSSKSENKHNGNDDKRNGDSRER